MNNARKIIIIGCGAGGGTAAQFARKTDRKATITIFEQDKYPQYSKCGLPYAISGDIPTFTDLIEFSQEWFENEHITLHLNTTVTAIDTKKQIITASGTKEIKQEYDALIIATGAVPTIPPIQNIQTKKQLPEGISVLRTIDHAKEIVSQVKKNGKATIIGAGLIGLEMADALNKKGMEVTIVEALPSILAQTLDEDMSQLVVQEIEKHINLYINHVVTKIEEHNNQITHVHIKNNTTQEEFKQTTDLLIIATGVKPLNELAKKIGCKIGPTGGIIVTNTSETSIKNIYAVGDCTEYQDFITHRPIGVGLGSIVVRQAIAAGINTAGGNYPLPKGVLLTRTSEFFGIEIAAVGPVKNDCKDMLLVSGRFTGSSHPEYFPKGEPITIKVSVDEKTEEIIYAQAIGSNAAQRINVFACALLNNMTIEALRRLETAYAPSIAPTLDTLTLACDVASLKLRRKKKRK